MNNDLSINGNRIILRPITKSDTESIIKWRNCENVRKQFIFRELLTKEMHLEWLATKVEKGEVVQFIINIKDDNIDIGSVYLRDIKINLDVAEFGIFIGEDDYRGMGFGSEACGLVLNYSWDVLKLKSVFLRVYRKNAKAIASYKRNGFFPISKKELASLAEINDIDPDIVFMKINSPKG